MTPGEGGKLIDEKRCEPNSRGVGGTDSVSLFEPQTAFPTAESGTLTCPGVVFTSYSIVGGPQNSQIPLGGSTFIEIAGGTKTLIHGGTTSAIISDNILLNNAISGPVFESSITFTSDPLGCDATFYDCKPASEPSVIVYGLDGNNQRIAFTFSDADFPLPTFPLASARDSFTLDYAHATSVTPEPGSLILFGAGFLALTLMLRKGLPA